MLTLSYNKVYQSLFLIHFSEKQLANSSSSSKVLKQFLTTYLRFSHSKNLTFIRYIYSSMYLFAGHSPLYLIKEILINKDIFRLSR